MAKWYYYDNNDQKQGSFSGGQLRRLAKDGVITPETIIEDEEGTAWHAGEVGGLTFSETLPSPPPSSVESNPFIAPKSTEENPFAAVKPAEGNPFAISQPVKPARVPNPEFQRKLVRAFMILAVFLILLTVCAIAWPIISESRNHANTSKKLIEEVFANKPLEIAGISVDWTDKPTKFEVVKSFWSNKTSSVGLTSSGKFTANAKITKTLYKPVSYEEGLRSLEITDTYEENFNAGMKKYRVMPTSLQNDCDPVPQNLQQIRFDGVLVPEGENITLTGSIKLTKSGNKPWQEDDIQVDPVSRANGRLTLDDFIPKSPLFNAHKLDDPELKKTVEKIIENRKEFVAKVDTTYDDWKFNEVQNEGIRKTILGKPLEISGVPSVDWTDKTADSASGKFTVKAKTIEKLYQSVDKKTVLEKWEIPKLYEERIGKLRIAEIFNKEIFGDDFLKQFKFYEFAFPEGTEVTLTGSIKLIKPNREDWRLDEIQVDSTLPALEGFAPDSQLQDAFKLDDPKTKETLETIVNDFVKWVTALLKQKYDFDKFCKDKRYKGSLKFQGAANVISFDVSVIFKESADPNANEVEGIITIPSPGWRGGRSFTVTVDTENVTEYPVTGTIDNGSLPTWAKFRENSRSRIASRADETSANRFYQMLHENIRILIKITNNEMTLSLVTRNEGNRTIVHLSEVRSDTNVPADKPLPNPNRNWVAPAMKKWVKENTETPQKAEQARNAEPGQKKDMLNVVDLDTEIRKAGFDPRYYTKEFIVYGTKQLQNDLEQAERNLRNTDDFRRPANQAKVEEIKRKIDEKREEIAKKTFLAGTFSYRGSNEVSAGDESAFTMTFSTNVSLAREDNKPVAEILFPVSDVSVSHVNVGEYGSSNIKLRINGSADSIMELFHNKDKRYQVRMYLKNLRCRDKNVYVYYSSTLVADIVRIEIVDPRQQPPAHTVASPEGRQGLPQQRRR